MAENTTPPASLPPGALPPASGPARPSVRASFIAQLVASLVLLNLVVFAVAGMTVYNSRRHHDQRAETTTRNLAQLLDHDISASLRQADLTLQSVADEAQLQMQQGPGAPAARHLDHFLARHRARNPAIDGIRVTGADEEEWGQGPTPELTAAENDQMQALRADANAGLAVVGPLMLPDRQWVMILGRRMADHDGGFRGVAQATLSLNRLTKAFSSIDLDRNGTVTLFDEQMTLLSREPAAPGSIQPGSRFGSPEAKGLLAASAREGTFRTVSTIDGVERVYSLRRMAEMPLYVSVGLAYDDFLLGWRHDLHNMLTLVALFMLASAGVSLLIYEAWKKQKQAADALLLANRRLDAEQDLNRIIVESSPLAIYTRDAGGLVTGWNRAAERMFGWEAREVIGKPLPTIPDGGEFESSQLRRRVFSGGEGVSADVRRVRRDGSIIEITSTLAPLRKHSGEIDGYVAIAVDITQKKAAEQRIEFLARHDALTSLPNRAMVQDRFGQAVSYAQREKHKVALVFLDLDDFKTINDSLGHPVGDALLVAIAERLSACVRPSDTVGRLGGDEFLIVLSALPDAESAVNTVSKIQAAMQERFDVAGHELATSASIGVAVWPEDGASFDALLQRADLAMYRAKDMGRNGYRFFDDQLNVEAVEMLAMRNGLRGAVERNEFRLEYQPFIELASGRIVGAEALVRWDHPQMGLIVPARFIHIAEDSGMILPIGEWVLNEACRVAREWQQEGKPPVVVAVNLSAVQFKRGDVEKSVRAALEASRLPPECLELEMTESVLIHDVDKVLATLQRLKKLGVKLAIDDFGTGYSSLSYLKRLDLDKIKIDRSFIRDLPTDPDDAAIVRAIIEMARELGLTTIAEGVEHEGLITPLRACGCDLAQGFHIAAPMPPTAFSRLLDLDRKRQNGMPTGRPTDASKRAL
ncbi:MAG: sensory box/GGDEF family protein [Paucimonas sp.]|nr:sensory box/GGDEF family protein [Paucimonas sp.]